MKQRFSIWIAQPRGWSHARAFIEVAKSTAYALDQLGYEVLFNPGTAPLIENPSPPFGRSILFAPTYLIDVPLAEDTILYNFEQVPDKLGSGPGTYDSMVSEAWLRGGFLQMFRRHTVWDYSRTNVERLRRLGIPNVHHCPVGYAPILSCIQVQSESEDIDVLFCGTVSEGTRRHMIYKILCESKVRNVDGTERSLRVQFLSGVYGVDRDSLIARAKIVLNIHNNPPEVAPAIWEIMRCSYLLANEKCIVSEDGSQDPDLGQFAAKATVYVPYNDIVRTCQVLLDEADHSTTVTRQAIARQGLNLFSKIDQVTAVKHALERSP